MLKQRSQGQSCPQLHVHALLAFARAAKASASLPTIPLCKGYVAGAVCIETY